MSQLQVSMSYHASIHSRFSLSGSRLVSGQPETRLLRRLLRRFLPYLLLPHRNELHPVFAHTQSDLGRAELSVESGRNTLGRLKSILAHDSGGWMAASNATRTKNAQPAAAPRFLPKALQVKAHVSGVSDLPSVKPPGLAPTRSCPVTRACALGYAHSPSIFFSCSFPG